MLDGVNVTPRDPPAQPCGREDKVDGRPIRAFLPGDGPSRQETIQAPICHEEHNRLRFPLTVPHRHLIASPQLIVAVEVPHNKSIEAVSILALDQLTGLLDCMQAFV
ncbi:hypothetical protein N7494_005089 [Penicillium frequentans]|uniref:Uncharacterized protein n=2 Tax=Penicillium frequentans TaxID=3151616 RepID=A0AAD6GFU8_9EURO|nr:hypothetical protein N7494_005089 [Penicillium glabrum]